MPNTVTLEEVEQRAIQLSPYEQLKLVAYLGERLSAFVIQETEEERQRRQYIAQLDAFVKMCEDTAAETIGAVDSAAEIRLIREERLAAL